ncbi:unnamed protein product [Mytilus edulis]|uniref:Uncharacterized protein n=1 Tax=Mytilus edulis TaxID=6550 RepID=A0A8S3UY66_MYTED|nr:unnamed protein product [Mytilus edulis]
MLHTDNFYISYIYTMEKCIVCLKDDHPTTLIKLRQKGCLGIIKASQERGDCLSALEDPSVKIASIGQAVMQASRPRALITPLQLGLGVHVHHNFASRFLVSTLNSLGFCSSYYEVQKFESSAAAVQGVDLPAGITPGTKRTQPIPRIAFSTDEIKALAKIEIKYYKPQSDRMAELSYAELKNLNTLDKTFRLDLLSVIIWPLKYPIPMWSGFMQMVQTGDYPGKSSVSFLPMIDLNASDMTCIYSTLNFVANQAKRYDITAILTFDQPLYWKALSIVENENPGSTLKSMVLRLGPFHTEMSFLGSIGNLMSNTGLKEMLELIYAPNAVTHILSGKAVARAFRGHMLVDTALYCLLIADIFNIDVSKLLEEPNSTLETTEMKEIDELYSQLSSGELSASEAGESDVLKNLEATVHRKQEILKQSRTAKLWLQYSEMVQVLRQFIKAERTDAGSLMTHGQTYYLTVTAVNSVHLMSYAFSGPIAIDTTPPQNGKVIDLHTTYRMDVSNNTATVLMNSRTCSTDQECDALDATCSESLTSVSLAWQPFTDEQSGVKQYEVAIGITPGGGQIKPFVRVPVDTLQYTVNGLNLHGHKKIYVSVRGTNGAGLSSVGTSNGVYMSYLSQGLPPLLHVGVYDVLQNSHGDVDFQESYDTYRASWDMSGDPCPVVKYEWQIQRLDGKVVMPWLDMGSTFCLYTFI